MKQFNLCFLGFGNVGRALARLLVAKSGDLRDEYGIDWRITGVATRRLGWLTKIDGYDVAALGSDEELFKGSTRSAGIGDWLRQAQADVVFETTSLNHESGQPAIDYIKIILQSGAHAITANKGTVVHAYDELNELGNSLGKRFLFESTVNDGAPVFSLFRASLPAIKLRGFSGILNSTSNVIIETLEAGRTFEEGVKIAQELGITETDPSNDVDGWDATMKVCALARVLMKHPLKPGEVQREGIRALAPQAVQAARVDGRPFKLVARAKLAADGALVASVKPEQLSANEPLGSVRGTSLAIHFELDVIPGLTIISHRPNLQSTAYGLLADFVSAVNPQISQITQK
jgi:homoserine dehydrogenase